MHNTAIALIITVVLLALIFDFINGFHDTATAIATSVSTRSLTPGAAIIMSAVLNFAGAFISTKVAKTVGAGIVAPSSIEMTAVIAALLGAITWNLITWYFGIPSSSSHALIGGLIGSAIIFKGSFTVVDWHNLFFKVILWLVLSPIIGFFIGYILMTLLNWILRPFRPASVSRFFSKAQIVSAALVAFNHGANDSQKSMGVITMALLSGGMIAQFNVPTWVKAACAISMGIGTSVGGWKIIKTMGTNMTKLSTVNGFAAQTSAAAIIFSATMFQAPVSTTHIMSGTIMGVGSSKRFSSVKWSLAAEMVWAWVLTIPITALISGLLIFVIKLL